MKQTTQRDIWTGKHPVSSGIRGERGGKTSGGEEKRRELGRKYRNFQLFLQVWAGRLAGFEGHIAVETVPFHVVGDAHDGRFGHIWMLGLRGREQEDGKGEGEGGRREGRQRMNARQRRLVSAQRTTSEDQGREGERERER
jgi:hypothetical protein